MLLMPGVVKKTTNLVHLDDHRCWQWGTNDLEALIDNLASVDHVTEQSFLELGSRIRLFHGQAQGISCVAGEVVQLLHGNDIENTLQHLQLLVERCSLWLSETGEKSTEICALLNSVMTQITDLDAAVDGLRKVTKTLHALRVSTRIEAAKGYASGAGVLARSLDELGRLVSEKITEIFERTELLVPMINQSLTMERAAQSGSIRTAHCEVKKARDLLTAFLTNCLETEQWTDRLKERSDDVTQNFGEMVAALQFQDITRQRLDHIQKALISLGEHLEKLTLLADSSRDEEASRLFSRICRLQHGQLTLAWQEFLSAADNLSENLHGMAASVVSMASDTRELSRSTDVGSDNRFAAVLDVLKTITLFLDETRTVHQSAGQHLSEVCQAIQAVSGLVEEVELIGEEMQLLAMNAAVSAAHARQRGAGLDIIAQNIHIVAEEATTYALVLARECETITRLAVHLQDVERETQTSAENIGCLLDDARERMTTIETNGTKLMVLAADVDQAAADLSEDVNNVAKTIDVRVAFHEKLAPALERLGSLAASADKEMTESDGVNLETLFGDLEHCYTMDSERQIHKQFIDKDDLSHQVTTGLDEWSANRDHGLGDNVDLF
jgi:methyl-accepting chemotaxis protein